MVDDENGRDNGNPIAIMDVQAVTVVEGRPGEIIFQLAIQSLECC